ncbi:MAG: PhnD/SsuA/transferrin family substrate-binding protein [Acidimicrobiia bacterium]|nr:PhnD/SsuA/transferrin family substrate-binding protein [Acidimicrobiia bacterium]
MRLRKLIALFAVLAMVAAACGGDDAGDDTTTTTAAAATTTTTAAPATTTTVEPMATVGSPENPVRVLFVPSVNTDVIVSGGDIMAEALNAATGLTFEVSVPTSYASTIEEMCSSPENSMGFIPGLGYILASNLCDVDVAFKAVRFGWPVYWAQVIVPRDSDVTSVADLDGLKWGYPDAGSTSGFMVPSLLWQENNVTPSEEVSAGGHTGTVRAVYNGEVDFGTTFFSPPLLGGGESWAPGDFPDVPDDLIPTCEVQRDGDHLRCGEDADGDGLKDFRVLDARAGLRTEAPDVIEKVKILEISAEIPNDTLSFGPEFPADIRAQIEEALIAFAETDAWEDSIGNGDFYDWSGIDTAVDSEYDDLREIVQIVGITLENIGE